MSEVKEILMERDGMTSEEADSCIDDIENQLYASLKEGNFEDAYYVLDELELEPDYLLDLL